MGVADLFNAPKTDREVAAWSFAHMAHHRDLNAQVFKLHNILLPEYVLDPIVPASIQGFLNLHQIMHNNLDLILGVSGNDLSQVDWDNVSEREGWIYLNATLHVAEAQKAGI
jgi:hypothetical protein